MIQVEKLTKEFDGQTVFRDIDLTINDGEVVAIIGPSGTGKSTFLRCLMTLEKPTSGKILLDGEEIGKSGSNLTKERERIGMVFQNFNLFDNMSVVENVMSGQVHLQKVPPKEAFDESVRLLKSVGLADKLYFYPKMLSGGQQQRAAIARTLAMKPEIILLDEPTSALDPMMRGEVEAVIRMMAAEGHTMVIVTHEMELVRQICSRVLFVDEGQIYEEGSPDRIFEHPQRTRTRRFVRALRVLEFDVQSKDFDFIGTSTAIAEYAYRNGIDSALLGKLQSVMEELFQMVIIQPTEENRMHISFEFNHAEKSINGMVRFTGPKIDPDDPMYFFSWPIILMRADSVTVEETEEDGYTNKVTLILK